MLVLQARVEAGTTASPERLHLVAVFNVVAQLPVAMCKPLAGIVRNCPSKTKHDRNCGYTWPDRAWLAYSIPESSGSSRGPSVVVKNRAANVAWGQVGFLGGPRTKVVVDSEQTHPFLADPLWQYCSGKSTGSRGSIPLENGSLLYYSASDAQTIGPCVYWYGHDIAMIVVEVSDLPAGMAGLFQRRHIVDFYVFFVTHVETVLFAYERNTFIPSPNLPPHNICVASATQHYR
jgi:hypothetical protein